MSFVVVVLVACSFVAILGALLMGNIMVDTAFIVIVIAFAVVVVVIIL